MASNLHRIPLAWVIALALAGLWETGVAQTPCPPRAGTLVAQAWTLLRADSLAAAKERFTQADRLCARNLDAKVGLGYVALRAGQLSASDSLFRLVIKADSSNADAWDGLTLAAWQGGDHPKALIYGRRAIRLNPKNPTTRNILDSIDPDWDRPPPRKPVRPSRLQLVSRTRGDRFEVLSAGTWRPFYINGVNMGVALPGKFPSEFPTDSATYAGWLDTIAAMHANTAPGLHHPPAGVLPRAPGLESRRIRSAALAGPWSLDRAAAETRLRRLHLEGGLPGGDAAGGRPAARRGGTPDPARARRRALRRRRVALDSGLHHRPGVGALRGQGIRREAIPEPRTYRGPVPRDRPGARPWTSGWPSSATTCWATRWSATTPLRPIAYTNWPTLDPAVLTSPSPPARRRRHGAEKVGRPVPAGSARIRERRHRAGCDAGPSDGVKSRRVVRQLSRVSVLPRFHDVRPELRHRPVERRPVQLLRLPP